VPTNKVKPGSTARVSIDLDVDIATTGPMNSINIAREYYKSWDAVQENKTKQPRIISVSLQLFLLFDQKRKEIK